MNDKLLKKIKDRLEYQVTLYEQGLKQTGLNIAQRTAMKYDRNKVLKLIKEIEDEERY